MSARTVAGVALLALLGAAVVLLARGAHDGAAGGSATLPGAGPTVALGGPSTCLPCHAQVVDEWKASMHAVAFTDPQVRGPEPAGSVNFSKQECLPCHAPAPVFTAGIVRDTRVLARVERRADGVDCLSCHGLPDGVAASRAGLTGACRPVQRAELSTELVCQACHNQHQTHDEWRASPAAAAGKDCLDCHMAKVERTGAEASAPRTGASHRFLGGRDREFALSGLTLAGRVEGRELVATLHNDFAGHNLPTDSRNRALDLVVTVFDARGREIGPPAGEAREPGCEAGTARLRFRNPYRASGLPSTQLPAGQRAEVRVTLPPGATRATVELFYKLEPWIEDRGAHWTQRLEMALPAAP